MTQFRPTDEDYNHVRKETEESKLARMEEEAKKARERAEGIRMFEDLSHRISKRIWEFIQEMIQGELYSSNEYHIADYILYRYTVTKLIEDKFGAEPPKHTKKGNVVVFNLDKLRKIQKSYDIDVDIKTTLKNPPKEDGEGGEGGEGYRQNASPSDGSKTVGNLDIQEEKTENVTRNTGSEGLEIPGAFLQDHSHPVPKNDKVLL